MEYERIHKVQTGVLSPSKLRMKILGTHHRRKEGGKDSSRTSPSKLEDMEYAKNSLLPAKDGDIDEGSLKFSEGASGAHVTVPNLVVPLGELSSKDVLGSKQGDQTRSHTKDMLLQEKNNMDLTTVQNNPKGFSSQAQSDNLGLARPVRSKEEENNGYDSGHDNGSSSSFEFHRGERILQSPAVGPFYRPVPSKWNDAEKWIVNRQAVHPHPNFLKKTLMMQSQGSRQVITSWVKVAPESMIPDPRSLPASDNRKINSNHSTLQNLVDKSSLILCGSHHVSEPPDQKSGLVDLSTVNEVSGILPEGQQEIDHNELLIAERTIRGATPAVKSVCMRDMGTDMTPVASQEPSRTGTPIGATTPTRSPISSRPSTPMRGAPALSPMEANTDGGLNLQEKNTKTELTEREVKLKTRREIVALGMQLGKMNIAAWASKDDLENDSASHKAEDMIQLEKIEFEARAAAWEEAEKTKHMARLKREEVRIQVWESHQKSKFEAQMKEVEVQAEQMKAQAQEKMMKRLASVRWHAEGKLSNAEAQKNRHAARTDRQVEHIRQTGHIPRSHSLCCTWFL